MQPVPDATSVLRRLHLPKEPSMPRRPKRTAYVDDPLRSRASYQRAPGIKPMPRIVSSGTHGTTRRMHEHHLRQAEYERVSRAQAALREAEQEKRAAERGGRRRRRWTA